MLYAMHGYDKMLSNLVSVPVRNALNTFLTLRNKESISSKTTVELQWLKHLWNHENKFETGVVRADECYSYARSRSIIPISFGFSF